MKLFSDTCCSLLQVLTSLDEAYITAGLKEGKAWAKYSFKGQSPKELSLRKVNPSIVVSLNLRSDDVDRLCAVYGSNAENRYLALSN